MQRYFILFMLVVIGLIFASFIIKGFLRRMSGRQPEDKSMSGRQPENKRISGRGPEDT